LYNEDIKQKLKLRRQATKTASDHEAVISFARCDYSGDGKAQAD
jgi:hypothetical protein